MCSTEDSRRVRTLALFPEDRCEALVADDTLIVQLRLSQMQLRRPRQVAVEEACRNLKGDLTIRPVFHRNEAWIEAHIFIAFLAYCMQVTLTRRLNGMAPGLTARSALEKFAAV